MALDEEETPQDKRRKLIKAIFRENFVREVTSIETLGRDSNNYAYRVSLKEQAAREVLPLALTQPGTTSLPPPVQDVVVRISNPDVLMNAAVRVENEVAAISLTRSALSNIKPSIVPEIYGWNTASSGNGWIVEEYMVGEPLDDAFPKLSADEQRGIVKQIAQVFKSIQSFELPSTITKYGGLNFNSEGQIISGDMTFPWGGPFDTFQNMYLATMAKQMQFSKQSKLANGWEGTGLPERLESFYSKGMLKVLDDFTSTKRTLVHGDFDLHNILFDPKTLHLTALLDFDFSHIASPADEYFYSFPMLHGLVAGPLEPPEMEALRHYQLNGVKPELQSENSDVDWKVAVAWDEELKNANVLRPSDIQGIDEIATIYWFLLDIAPPWFELKRWQARNPAEKQEEARKEVEGNLDKYLERWGY